MPGMPQFREIAGLFMCRSEMKGLNCYEPKSAPAALTEDFFREYGVGVPEAAVAAWQAWSRGRRRADANPFTGVMHLCLGGAVDRSVESQRSASTCRVWWDTRIKKKKRQGPHIGVEKYAQLDRIGKALGLKVGELHEDIKRKIRVSRRQRRRDRVRRVVLMSELESIPSEGFHLTVMRGITSMCWRHNIVVTLHGVTQAGLEAAVDKVCADHQPDGVLMMRLTPGAEILKRLDEFGIPVVLIHADRFRYPAPVLANIIPNLESVGSELKKWLGRRTVRRAVVVSMRPEAPRGQFEPVDAAVELSIRNDRRQQILAGLKRPGRQVEIVDVDDYCFRHGHAVFERHPEADLYVALCDPIAIELKHLLATANRPAFTECVVGFDASEMSRVEGIASFDQGLEEIGGLAGNALCGFFHDDDGRSDPWWPAFVERRCAEAMLQVPGNARDRDHGRKTISGRNAETPGRRA